jgi:hypothetical protein
MLHYYILCHAACRYTVVRYDKFDTLTDTLDDVTSVAMLRELVDWCGKDALMRQLADTSQVGSSCI